MSISSSSLVFVMSPMILLLIGVNCSAIDNNQERFIQKTLGKYNVYYHMKYKLKNDNYFIESIDLESLNDSGQFEVRLKKDQFPINAPNCNTSLILRMPATLNDDKNANVKINEKKALFEKMVAIKEKATGSVDVVIEINPYMKVLSKEPLRLELTQCNIFFRTKAGEYIDEL